MGTNIKNISIKYIVFLLSLMLASVNLIFNANSNYKKVLVIALIILIFNLMHDLFIRRLKEESRNSKHISTIRYALFFYTYISGAYGLYLSGAFDNSSILIYFTIVVFLSIDLFGKKSGTLIYIFTLFQEYVYYSVFIDGSSLWRISMAILSLSLGYILGLYFEGLKKNQILLKEKINEMEMLFQISKLIDEFPGVDQIFSGVTKIIVDYLGVSECYLMIYDEEKGDLVNRSTYTRDDREDNDSIPKILSPGSGFPGRVFLSGESVFYYEDGVEKLEAVGCSKREIKSFGIVPIKFKDKTIGTITITSRTYMKNDIQSERLLETIASRVGMVINSQRMFKKLENASRKDSLTGLFNHGYFYEKLEYDIRSFDIKNKSIFVVMMDLDKFKYINDRYGHLVGDEVLKKIGESLKSFEGADMISARYGGEEFGLIVRSSSLGEIIDLLDDFREKISRISTAIDELRKDKINITISIGIAEYIKDSHRAEELIDIADKRMYLVKENGGNDIIY